jgi:hypothetical protein
MKFVPCVSMPLFGKLLDCHEPARLTHLPIGCPPFSTFLYSASTIVSATNFNAQSSLVAGAANGDFSESPNVNSGGIGLNGLYYSFMIQAVAAGTGSISFDPTPNANEYAANETGFNFVPLNTTGNLSFTITPASVPEPSSIAMLGVGIAALGYLIRARKRLAA